MKCPLAQTIKTWIMYHWITAKEAAQSAHSIRPIFKKRDSCRRMSFTNGFWVSEEERVDNKTSETPQVLHSIPITRRAVSYMFNSPYFKLWPRTRAHSSDLNVFANLIIWLCDVLRWCFFILITQCTDSGGCWTIISICVWVQPSQRQFHNSKALTRSTPMWFIINYTYNSKANNMHLLRL